MASEATGNSDTAGQSSGATGAKTNRSGGERGKVVHRQQIYGVRVPCKGHTKENVQKNDKIQRLKYVLYKLHPHVNLPVSAVTRRCCTPNAALSHRVAVSPRDPFTATKNRASCCLTCNDHCISMCKDECERLVGTHHFVSIACQRSSAAASTSTDFSVRSFLQNNVNHLIPLILTNEKHIATYFLEFLLTLLHTLPQAFPRRILLSTWLAHQRICAVDRFANSYQEFLLQQLGISACFSPPKSDITSNIRFGSPCNLLSGVPPTNFASFYLCISALMSGVPSTTIRDFCLFLPTEVRFGSPCKLLSGVPPTNFASFYLCISALMSERTYEYVRLIEFGASKGYEWLISLQTLVRCSFYQFCIFLPVYICIEVWLLYLFRLTEVRASNGYERLIGLQTLAFQPVSPHSCQGFLPVSPHRSQCNEPLSRAGSFLASTGLPPRSLLNDDTPVSICGFEYNIYSQSQQRPPPYITTPPALAPRTLIVLRSTVLLPGLQVPVGLR
ncbi:hypothetical protein T07_332 [Trichinella nelsoni]|uniref:Uncharacterized protein n=1 Tax=Trichinella nelsoni TaxID=6336 RepID=A0A0V0RHX6_9BILA|nr:hypothetical protein T07_332 [Trichinella nelsoni]